MPKFVFDPPSPLPRTRRSVALALLLVLVMAATSRLADAAVVTGTLTYEKVLDSTGVTVPRPIPFATVEIWYRDVNWWDIWSHVSTATTDADGRIQSGNDGRCRGTYALRVFAINYAAVVKDISLPNAPFWGYPGRPGPEIQRSATSCGSALDFSFDFADPYATQHYNIAETIRRGFDYANARRDPRERDSLSAAVVQPTSAWPNSYYNPVLDMLFINSSGVNDDLQLLHEYGHFLEAKLSTFAPIISNHDGCTATDAVFGHRLNSSEHAWMEGFADFFAQAVRRTLPGGTLNTTAVPARTTPLALLETPSACGAVGQSAGSPVFDGRTWTITPSMIEDFVAGIIWDLLDASTDSGAARESFDLLGRQDARVFQIFDREMGRLGRWPTIFDFYCGWMDRGLPRLAVDRLFTTRGIPLPTCPGPLSDSVVWRPTTGEWFNATTGQSFAQWGAPGDIPVPGFYDGDGIPDVAVWRPSTGEWFIGTRFGANTVQQWGATGDVPAAGDYDGDGRFDMAIWRPSTGEWWIINSSTGSVTARHWGQFGDVPVPADYDLDGRTDMAIWRPSDGMWWIINSATGSTTARQWGQFDDVPVPADYDLDGRTDFAIWRPAYGMWWIVNSSTGSTTTRQWGQFGDVPVPADYDHDRRTDFAVWRPASGEWFIIESASGRVRAFPWGYAGDVPIVPGPRFQ